ncbi:MAG: Synechococcus phage [Pseudomonadota bacterium]|jgi:hypothetical protein
MADSKITALTALTAADPVNDMFPVVDVSDTTMAASGTTKKISVNNILSSSPTASGALTVTGLVTAGSATITGDLTVDTNVLAVNATTNAVGIGTTVAPVYSSKLRVEGGVEIHTSQALNIQPGNTNPYEIVNRSAGGFAFYPTGTTLGLTLAPSGDLSLATGNVVMTTSGKGIDFSATANGSGTMTSELLNDYEEGTWTPNIGGTATYTGQTGTYTKIGNRVYVSLRLSVLVAGTGEDFRISGLPFASGSGLFAVSVGYFSSLKTNAAFLSGYVTGSQICMTGTTVSTATITNLIAVIGNGTDIAISGFYNV